MQKETTTEQTVIDQLKPLHYSAVRTLRSAKDRSGYTVQQIADATGVSEYRIGRMLRGEVSEPDAYSLSAVCKFLNVSMDRLLIDKDANVSDSTELQYKVRELESKIEHQKEIIDIKDHQIAIRKPLIYSLIFIIIIMALLLMTYMIIDSRDTSVGLVQETVSPLFIIVGLVVIVGIGLTIYTLVRSKK